MTPKGRPLSEKGKIYAICILFPIFWIFLPVLLICDLGEWIRDKIRDRLWKWKHRNDSKE